MSIVNNFKKILKNEEEVSAGKNKSAVAKKNVKVKKDKSVKETAAKTGLVKKAADKNPDTFKVLKYPLITEKTTDLSIQNKYIFVVSGSTNKNEVKKAVESLYGVKTISVNIVKVPGKKRRRGRVEGWRSGFKKAIVTLKEGDKIEIVSH